MTGKEISKTCNILSLCFGEWNKGARAKRLSYISLTWISKNSACNSPSSGTRVFFLHYLTVLPIIVFSRFLENVCLFSWTQFGRWFLIIGIIAFYNMNSCCLTVSVPTCYCFYNMLYCCLVIFIFCLPVLLCCPLFLCSR